MEVFLQRYVQQYSRISLTLYLGVLLQRTGTTAVRGCTAAAAAVPRYCYDGKTDKKKGCFCAGDEEHSVHRRQHAVFRVPSLYSVSIAVGGIFCSSLRSISLSLSEIGSPRTISPV